MKATINLFFKCLFIWVFNSLQMVKVDPRHYQNLSSKSGDSTSASKQAIRIDVPNIISVSACADLTLPPGAGLSIDTIHGPIFLVRKSLFLHYFHCQPCFSSPFLSGKVIEHATQLIKTYKIFTSFRLLIHGKPWMDGLMQFG